MKLRQQAILGIVACLGLAALPATAYASDAQVGARTVIHKVPICDPSKHFRVTSWDARDLGDRALGAWGWAHNRTSSKATFSVALKTDSQVTYSISATVTVNAGVIFASASAAVTVGLQYSHTDTISKTLTITIPAHEYGVIGVDNIYYRFWGTYTVLLRNCTVKRYRGVFAEFPAHLAQGLEGKNITYVPTRPPWPLAP